MEGGAEAQPRQGSIFAVLRHRHFRNVFVASFVSSMGGWMEIVGMQWAMTQATLAEDWVRAGYPGAPIMMAYLGAAQLGPTLVFGLLGGVLADSMDRKKLLLVTQVLMMGIAGLLAALAALDRLTPVTLIALGAAHGLVMAFNIPAWQVLTPRLVPRHELTGAITLNGMQFNLARALGPALGGLIMSAWGEKWLFVINTASFLAVIAAVAGTPPSPAPEKTGQSALQQIRAAGAYVLRSKGAMVLIVGIAIFSMLATPMLRLLPILVKEVHRAEERAFGFMLGALGLGAVLGALTIRVVPFWYPKHHFIPLAMTLCGLSIAGVAAATSLPLALLAMGICGIFWLWAFNAAFAALQLLVDDAVRGRVMAICNTISFGTMAVGALLAGAMGEAAARRLSVNGMPDEGSGTIIALGATAVLLVVYGVASLTWRTPEIDGIAPGDPGYERAPGLFRGMTASAHREQRQGQPASSPVLDEPA